jgi:ABC-type uncharacterized transport system permease subunit
MIGAMRFDPRRMLIGIAAPVLAVLFAFGITSLVLLATGDEPIGTLSTMLEHASRPRNQVLIINLATTYYLSALAVAVGFRMKLFNIGVDGQYRLAAMMAAVVGGAISLPKPLHIAVVVLTAMAVGAVWAGIAGLLKVVRGVSEVISTIMLNVIATGVVAWLLTPEIFAVPVAGSNNIGTKPIPESGHMPGLPLIPGTPSKVFGFIIVAAVAGLAYWVLLERTKFGFDLRASGRSETAAMASGVNVKRMVLMAMLISGMIAGLVGMPQLLGSSYQYSLDFPAGLGFTGIAIALLGRNHPVGIAIGALLWGFLDGASNILDFEGIAPEIVKIMQGGLVLSVVVAYELVRRYGLAAEQRRVGRELARQTSAPEGATA